jgi:hypothetical protein
MCGGWFISYCRQLMILYQSRLFDFRAVKYVVEIEESVNAGRSYISVPNTVGYHGCVISFYTCSVSCSIIKIWSFNFFVFFDDLFSHFKKFILACFTPSSSVKRCRKMKAFSHSARYVVSQTPAGPLAQRNCPAFPRSPWSCIPSSDNLATSVSGLNTPTGCSSAHSTSPSGTTA